MVKIGLLKNIIKERTIDNYCVYMIKANNISREGKKYNRRMVYVGQTKNLRKRLMRHMRVSAWARLTHDHKVFYISCHKKDIDRIEKELINIIKPEFNIRYN